MIVGFTGKAGAGKSTAAGMLIDAAVSLMSFGTSTLISFADPIKQIARDHFGWDGRKDERGRRLLQVLGTEAGRAYNPNIWGDRLMKKAQEFGPDTLICVDDVRFIGEAEEIRARGGHVFRVIGRGDDLGNNAAHTSERGLPDCLVTDTLVNDGDRDALRPRVRDLLDRYLLPVGVMQ
jgi:hypothetical protein